MDNNAATVNGDSTPPILKGNVPPSPEQVRCHLDQVISSEVFTGALRQQRMLRYLVEKSLLGAAAELKEYTLGVEVFDRGSQFDPRLDPIVRVEASRLRSRLKRYYEEADANSELRIELPRGAYIPSFIALKSNTQAEAAVNGTSTESSAICEVPTRSGSKKRTWAITAAVAGVAALTAMAWFRLSFGSKPSPPRFVRFSRITDEPFRCTFPAFSPDGKEIAYARQENSHWKLYRKKLGSLGAKPFFPGSENDDYQPAYAPRNNLLAFRSDRNGGGIFTADLLSGSISRLTAEGFYPSWSPDTHLLAYATETFNDPMETAAAKLSVLQAIDIKTRITWPLTDNKLDAQQPAWSPHGNRIAFWGTGPNGNRDVWTVEIDLKTKRLPKPVPVTHDPWTDWSPAWSADGRYLYFSSDRGGAMNLWRVRIDEETGMVLSSPEPVTTPSAYSAWAVFAPNGTQFAYVHRLVSSKLYEAPFTPETGVDVNSKIQLTAGEQRIREPEMSPDGSTLVARIQDPQEDLALLKPNGSGLRRLTNDAFSDRSPHWSPDGRHIVFLSNRSGKFESWIMSPDGSGLQQLTHGGSLPSAWTPDGSLLGYPEKSKPVVLLTSPKSSAQWTVPSAFRPLAWSPNRKSVVGRMQSDAFNRGALFIYTPGTEDYWQIAAVAPYPSVVWLRNGDQLLFSRDDGIYLADLPSHQLRLMLAKSIGGLHSRFTLSRDERKLFFVLADDEEDIWLGSE